MEVQAHAQPSRAHYHRPLYRANVSNTLAVGSAGQLSPAAEYRAANFAALIAYCSPVAFVTM